jgi:hypothetical protein
LLAAMLLLVHQLRVLGGTMLWNWRMLLPDRDSTKAIDVNVVGAMRADVVYLPRRYGGPG